MSNEKELYFRLWNLLTEELLIIIDGEDIVFKNDKACELVEYIKVQLKSDIHYLIKAIPKKIIEIEDKKYYVESFKECQYQYILLKDITEKYNMNSERERIRKIKKDFQMLWDSIADDSMYITDGYGNTLFVGNKIAEQCGVEAKFLIGRNVFDLEDENIFSPSICAKVINTLQNEIIFQKTSDGKQSIAMGFPIFDEDNKLKKVYSFSKLIKSKNGTGKNYKIESLDYEVDEFYPEIISVSSNMMALKEMIKICAKVDSPIMIYGETGSGKGTIAKTIYKFSRFNNSHFFSIDCNKIITNNVVEFNNFNHYLKMDKGIIYLKDIDVLPIEYQKVILKILKKSKEVEGDFRIITATSLKEEEIDNRVLPELKRSLCTITLNTLPLRNRRDDILLLIKYYLMFYNNLYEKEKVYSNDALRLLYAYDWFGNVRELQLFVESSFLLNDKVIQDVHDIPEYIKTNNKSLYYIELCKNAIESDYESATLDEKVAIFEKLMISKALEQSKNASEAALKLQLTHSTMCRKMKKYNIEP